jgi:hypothetical protein
MTYQHRSYDIGGSPLVALTALALAGRRRATAGVDTSDAAAQRAEPAPAPPRPCYEPNRAARRRAERAERKRRRV